MKKRRAILSSDDVTIVRLLGTQQSVSTTEISTPVIPLAVNPLVEKVISTPPDTCIDASLVLLS
jgi:hypothetical protein